MKICEKYEIKPKILSNLTSLKLLVQAKDLIPADINTNKHIFDFADEGTFERMLFEDDINALQRFLAIQTDDYINKKIVANDFFPETSYFYTINFNPLVVAALFGSVKCFKYLMMNEYQIQEDVCKTAIAGGNIEIVHLCEQNGLLFNECLELAVMYHRYDLFEWLNTHYIYIFRIITSHCFIYTFLRIQMLKERMKITLLH